MKESKFHHTLKWLEKETLLVLPAVIYFCIAFNLIYFTTGLNQPVGEVRYFSSLSVTIDALILGKVLIITNSFPFINAFPHKPLIYNIFWKFFLYMLVTIFFWVLETIVDLTGKYKHFETVFQKLQFDLHSPIFWGALLWLASVFFIFIVFSEFVRVLGKDKILYILLKNKNL